MLKKIPFWITYVFLYVPIVVVVAMSFNAGDSPYSWSGFSFSWYAELAKDEQIRIGLGNTLLVATGSTVIATVLGTLLAVGLARHTRSKILDAIATLPVILPDIVLAIGLLAFYSLIQLTLGCTRCYWRTRSSGRPRSPPWSVPG